MNEGERIVKLETQMDNIEKKVDDGFKTANKRFDHMEQIIKDFVENSDNKFADKWVEKAVWLAGTTIIIAVIGAWMSGVLK